MNEIYFAGSITSGRNDVDIYFELVQHLKKYGHVLTTHIGDRKISSMGENLPDREIFQRDMGWLEKASHLVAEVTNTSTGVGYELGRIAERNLWVGFSEKKKILCLYRPQVDKRLSAMVKGSSGLKIGEYQNIEEARAIIDRFFK